jgi:hypothetical protein
MMLDQNENSEQLALIKSMVLTNPIATSIYIISMTSLLFPCTAKRIRLYLFEWRKIQCSTIIQFTNSNLVIKTHIWESFQKSGKKVSEDYWKHITQYSDTPSHCNCYCFRYSVWNHFSVAQRHLDRSFNCW